MQLQSYNYLGCRVFHFTFHSDLELVLSLARAEEFTTHKVYAGKHLTIGNFFDSIQKVASAENEFYGCCLTGLEYRNWFEGASLILQEHKIYVQVQKHLDNCIIIGTVDGDKETESHEFAHVFYNKNNTYRLIANVLVNTMPREYHDNTEKYLTKMEYPERDFADEKQAFWSTSGRKELTELFNIDSYDVKDLRSHFRREKSKLVKL